MIYCPLYDIKEQIMWQSSKRKRANEIFERYKGNPILTPKIWPYPARAVINPGAILLGEETILFVRVENMNGICHLTVARSTDGLTNWEIDPTPSMEADQNSQEEKLGLEDPRIIWLEEQKQFGIAYLSISKIGPAVSMIITKNFRTFARLGTLLPPESKDASFFPHRIKGRFVLIYHRIVAGEANMWITFSADLKHWGDHRLLLGTRSTSWDRDSVGLGPQPIETSEGWIILYYGVCNTTGGATYRVGAALLDFEEPWRVIRRSDEWLLEPRELYECIGDVGNVVFPTGVTVNKKTNQVNLYYGAADRCIGVATADLGDLLKFLLSCPEPRE